MKTAGFLEIWAARAWNVFNEGRPFSIVYPVMCLLAAWPLGLAPDGPLGLALLGAARPRGGAGLLPVPAARARVALARRGGIAAAARELARARAAGRGARRLPLLHRLLLGHALLPPPHRRAVDQLRPLLAPRPDQLGPHERQRARADPEVRARALGGDPAGGGAERGERRADRSGGADRRGAGCPRLAHLCADAAPQLPRSRYPWGLRSGDCGLTREACVRARDRRLQPRAAMAGKHADDRPARPRGHASTWRSSRRTRPARSSASPRCSRARRRWSTACARTSRRAWV